MGEGNPGIDVQIKAPNFDEFVKKVEKLQEKLKSSQSAWSNMTAGSKALYISTRLVYSTMAGITGYAKQFTSYMLSTIRGFERWTKSVSELGKIFGAGGIFGINESARNAMDSQRFARGIGSNTSNVTSFGIAMDKYLGNSNDFLSRVAQVQTNPGSPEYRGAIGGLHMSEADRQAMSPTDFGLKILTEAQRFAKSGSSANMLSRAHGLGIDSIVSPETLMVLRNTPDNEFRDRVSSAVTDKNKYAVSDADYDKLTKLWATFEDFLQTVNTGFLKLLADSSPLLEALSDTLKTFIEGMIDSKGIHEIVGMLVSKLTELLNWVKDMGPDGMAQRLKALFTTLVEDMEVLSKAFDYIMPWLKLAAGKSVTEAFDAPDTEGTSSTTLGEAPSPGYKTSPNNPNIDVPDDPPVKKFREFAKPNIPTPVLLPPNLGRNLDPMNFTTVTPTLLPNSRIYTPPIDPVTSPQWPLNNTDASPDAKPYGNLSSPFPNAVVPDNSDVPALPPNRIYVQPPDAKPDQKSSMRDALHFAANTYAPDSSSQVDVSVNAALRPTRSISDGFRLNRRQLAMNIYSAPGTNSAISIGGVGIALT